MTEIHSQSEFYKRIDFLIPAAMGILYAFCFFFFNPFFYLGLAITLVGLVQVYPLSSRMTENLIFFCFPIIGLTANVHAVCLNYNSVVLFLLCRSYAIYGRLILKHIVAYFMVIFSWLFYRDAPLTIYMGGILHGIMHPLNFFLLKRRSRILNHLVFLIPIYMMLDNAIQYKKYFVAFWDVEILSLYFFWALGYDKETVVKRVFLFSFPLINFAQIYWDVCPITILK